MGKSREKKDDELAETLEMTSTVRKQLVRFEDKHRRGG